MLVLNFSTATPFANHEVNDYKGLLKFLAANSMTLFAKQDPKDVMKQLKDYFLQRTYLSQDESGNLIIKMPGKCSCLHSTFTERIVDGCFQKNLKVMFQCGFLRKNSAFIMCWLPMV